MPSPSLWGWAWAPTRGLLAAAAALAAACAPPAAPPPVPWLYEANLALGPRPPATGGFGRGVRPLSLVPAGITAAPDISGGPLAVEELITAEDGAAEAVAFGGDTASGGQTLCLELVDVDAGVVRWRNTTTALTPRAFAGDAVIAGDDNRTAAVDRHTGVERWRHDGAFRGRDGDLVAIAASDGLLLVDARDGSTGVALLPPAGLPPGAVQAVCASPTPHVFAFRDGTLSRWDVDGTDLRATWAVPSDAPSRLDACGETVLVIGGDPRMARALDPLTGAVVGGPVAARELWPARHGDGVELATPDGIEQRDRRLGAPRLLEPARVGRLIARRGAARLVARGDGGLVLLDDHGARALAEPFGAGRVALGDRAVVGGTWSLPARTLASRLTRYLLPPPGAVAEPVPPLGKLLIGDPPRIDLPPPVPLPDAVVRAGAGAWSVGAAIVDPEDPTRVYVHVLEERPSATRGAGVAAFDLRRNVWLWHAPDACPPGMAVALAATAHAVVCGSRQLTPGTGALRAVDRDDGHTLWDWTGVTVDTVLAADTTLLVMSGARVTALDPATGAERLTWRASDGWLPRVALLRDGHHVIVASLEHGSIVLRSAAYGLRPLAALEVRGVVAAMTSVADRALVVLTDGTAYFVDGRGTAVAAAGLATGWDAAGDLALVSATDTTGADGVVAAFGTDGIAGAAVTLPGTGLVQVTPRATVPDAPLALVGGTTGPRIFALSPAGVPLATVALPDDAVRTPIVSTAVDGVGVVAAVLARPLRLVRVDLGPRR